MRLVVAGLSHHSAPVAVRERAVVSDADAPTLLRYLVGHAGLSGAAVLSTCNRTEFYLSCPEEVVDDVLPRVSRYLEPGGSVESTHLTARRDEAAVTHLFRVAAGLDSMVIGEAQILGQVKAAHRVARAAGTLDARLDFLFRRAQSAGKRVRSETLIGRGAGSITEVAIDQARGVLGDLRGRSVLLVGAGKMTALAGRRLIADGVSLRISSRSGTSAADLAARLGSGATAIDAGDLVAAAADVDVILASTSSPEPVITAHDVERIQAARAGRPLAILDLAVPRDVAPVAAEVDGVHLFDLDRLGGLVETNLTGRRRHLPRAEALVAVDVAGAVGALAERDGSGTTIRALTKHAETLRRGEVERARRGATLNEAEIARLDIVTRSLVRKLLHAPIAHLRERDDEPSLALALRDAFDLESGGVGRSR